MQNEHVHFVLPLYVCWEHIYVLYKCKYCTVVKMSLKLSAVIDVHNLCFLYIGTGRGVLLPKDVSTLWKIVEDAHEKMTAKISYVTVVIPIPEEVMARYTKPL